MSLHKSSASSAGAYACVMVISVRWVKKWAERQSCKKQCEDVDVVGAGDREGAMGLNSDHKSQEQVIQDRISYKPQLEPNRSSQFGNQVLEVFPSFISLLSWNSLICLDWNVSFL